MEKDLNKIEYETKYMSGYSAAREYKVIGILLMIISIAFIFAIGRKEFIYFPILMLSGSVFIYLSIALKAILDNSNTNSKILKILEVTNNIEFTTNTNKKRGKNAIDSHDVKNINKSPANNKADLTDLLLISIVFLLIVLAIFYAFY